LREEIGQAKVNGPTGFLLGAWRTKAAISNGGFTLTKDQEKDYDSMVDGGWTGSREQYHAKWKARAEKFKAAGKPAPKTFRAI